MRWRKQKTLETLEKETPDGDWEASNTFLGVHVAYEWHILPSRLGICDPEDDLRLMLAYIDAKGTMANKDAEVSKKEAERQARAR